MKKILIVDDLLMNRMLIKTIISKNIRYHCDIDEATDGVEAVSLCTEKDYDLVFMDLKMPNMEGDVATVKIKEHKPNINIVSITSAKSDLHNLDVFNDFLIKPFTLDGVIGVFNKFVKN